MIINVITPCSRPVNLEEVGESIFTQDTFLEIRWYVLVDKYQKTCLPYFDNTFYIYFPTHGKSVVGHKQRNKALDIIKDGYIYSVDDDNIMHPDLLRNIEGYMDGQKVIVVDQIFKNQTIRLEARPENTKVYSIDTAQYIVPREVIGDKRFPLCYEGDGLFIEEIHKNNKDNFMFINKPLSYYNYLR